MSFLIESLKIKKRTDSEIITDPDSRQLLILVKTFLVEHESIRKYLKILRSFRYKVLLIVLYKVFETYGKLDYDWTSIMYIIF